MPKSRCFTNSLSSLDIPSSKGASFRNRYKSSTNFPRDLYNLTKSNSGGGSIVTALWLFAIEVKICSNLKAFSTQCPRGAVAVGVALTRLCLSRRSSSSNSPDRSRLRSRLQWARRLPEGVSSCLRERSGLKLGQ